MIACYLSSNYGGAAEDLHLELNAKVPKSSGPKQMFVKALTVSLSSIDHKPTEMLLYHFAFSTSTAPGAVGEDSSSPRSSVAHKGDHVFGTVKNAFAGDDTWWLSIQSRSTNRVVSLSNNLRAHEAPLTCSWRGS